MADERMLTIFDRLTYSNTLATSNSTSTEVELSSITELKATGQIIEKLQEGWQNIHQNNLDNFEKSQVKV